MILNLIWMSLFILSVIISIVNLILNKKFLSIIACICYGLWYIIFIISIINGGII